MYSVISGLFSGLVAATIIVPSVQAQPASGPELLDYVRDAHRATRESIQTCSCRVEFSGTLISQRSGQPNKESCSGQFWYAPNVVRAHVAEFGLDRDYLWKDSVRKEVTRRSSEGKKEVSAGLNRFESRHLGRCDAYSRGLLMLNLPNTIRCVPFETLLEKATKWKSVERRSVEGKEVVIVRLLFRGQNNEMTWDVDITFDPAVNYLVRKTVYSGSLGEETIHREDEVTRFQECAPGVFFPERLAGRSGPAGSPNFNHTTVFSEVRVNQPIPASTFQFHYPNGVYLADGVRGVGYRVDPEGRPISKESPLGVVPPPPGSEAIPSEAQTETQEEPRSFSRWILPFSIGVILVAGVLAVYRRARKARPADS